MDFAIFRAGKYLLGGQVMERRGDISVVNLFYKVTKPMERLGGVGLPVHESLIVRKFKTHEELQTLIGAGSLPTHFKLETWERLRPGLPHGNLALEDVEVTMETLEAVRPQLAHLGFVHPKRPVLGTFGECKAFKALMKANPFRDVCQIPEGTITGITGYYKGCAVVEADGEVFWVPVEEMKFIESQAKDLDYYFRLDRDRDNIPDPLASLPSHQALTGAQSVADPTSPQDNWQVYPQQSKIAGNLYPLPDIDMDDVSILRDELPPRSKYTAAGLREGSGGTTAEYFYYYQLHKPALHGVSGPTLHDIADALVAGAPVEAMFLQDLDYAELERAYLEAFRRVFPGATPDLVHLKAIAGSHAH